MKRTAISALVLLAACSPRRERPAPPVIPPDVIIARIGELEDARRLDGPFMSEAASHASPEVRERLAVALGRIMKPETFPLFVVLQIHSKPSEWKSLVFAAGQMGLAPDGLSPDDTRHFLRFVTNTVMEPDEKLRALSVEAMGKLALDQAPRLAAPLLKDPSPLVRRQAASACFRWRRVLRTRDPAATPPPLAPEIVEALSAAASDADAETRWRAIHALLQGGRMPSEAALKGFARDSDPLARLFALMIVERHKVKALADDTAKAQLDGDANVRQAALRALDALDRPELLNAILVKDPSHHVREAVADLLAEAGPTLETLSKDASVAVRSAALLARVRIAGESWADHMEEPLADPDPRIRIAVVKAAGFHKEKGLPILWLLKSDAVEAVRAAVMVVLADIPGDMAWKGLREGLAAKSLAERATAVEGAGKRTEADVVEALIQCYKESGGREWVEVREMIVDVLGGRPPDATTPFLLEVAKSDPAPSVQQKAAAALRRRGAKDVPDGKKEPPTRSPHLHGQFDTNPTVVVETTKGTMEIECLAREAPVHVANFVGLVESGFYNGRTWFRVVPNFVIQGGDPLDNGWGDCGWNVRAEVNPVRYERGTLGMPRSAGWDTGSCQLFITHIPTPHLDGFYTVFGRVVKGLDVIDRIEIGDKIVKATLKR